MHPHEDNECPGCGATRRCRCFSPDKKKTFNLCNSCQEQRDLQVKTSKTETPPLDVSNLIIGTQLIWDNGPVVYLGGVGFRDIGHIQPYRKEGNSFVIHGSSELTVEFHSPAHLIVFHYKGEVHFKGFQTTEEFVRECRLPTSEEDQCFGMWLNGKRHCSVRDILEADK